MVFFDCIFMVFFNGMFMVICHCMLMDLFMVCFMVFEWYVYGIFIVCSWYLVGS